MPEPSRHTVYLDHAASTTMVPQAIEAMNAAFARPGNASSLHGSGRQARRRIEEARESLAASVGARPSEVIFTSGGTEADNLAVKGIYWARRAADERRRRIVVSAIEHHAVLDPAQWLAGQGRGEAPEAIDTGSRGAVPAGLDERGAELVVLPVDSQGFVSPDALRAELAAHGEETALVSVMWANNEIGTIEPIAELARIAAEFGVPMHSDAVQAVGHIAVDFAASGLSAMSLAAHKFGGPQGIGALLLGRDVACVPLLHGGGHERDLRSGTQPVAAAVAMAAALRTAVDGLPETMAAVAGLRDELYRVLLSVPGSTANGPAGPSRLPGIAHVSFAGCEGDSLLMLLDANGVECSTGSACTAGVAQASHVLLALGLEMDAARGSLRFSLAPSTTRADIERVAEVIGEVVDRARGAGLVASSAGRSH